MTSIPQHRPDQDDSQNRNIPPNPQARGERLVDAPPESQQSKKLSLFVVLGIALAVFVGALWLGQL